MNKNSQRSNIICSCLQLPMFSTWCTRRSLDGRTWCRAICLVWISFPRRFLSAGSIIFFATCERCRNFVSVYYIYVQKMYWSAQTFSCLTAHLFLHSLHHLVHLRSTTAYVCIIDWFASRDYIYSNWESIDWALQILPDKLVLSLYSLVLICCCTLEVKMFLSCRL